MTLGSRQNTVRGQCSPISMSGNKGAYWTLGGKPVAAELSDEWFVQPGILYQREQRYAHREGRGVRTDLFRHPIR